MSEAIDDATAGFLEAAAKDLQRQIGSAGIVERVVLEDSSPATELTARIRVGNHVVEMRGTGENLVEAYGDLHRGSPVPMLTAAFRQLLEGA